MKSLAIATLLLAACGGDDTNTKTPDASTPNDVTKPDGSTPVDRIAYVVAGDFTAGHPGVLSRVDVDTKTVTTNVGPQGAVGDDPLLRKFGSELFIINRADTSNITILKASDASLVEQLSTGTNSNPQDAALVGNKIYVPTLAGKGVVVLTRGSSTTKEIDLSADDPDGKPNCMSAYAVGTKVYVACGLLDDTMQFLPPRGNGKIYIIDTATDTKTGSFALTSPNPIGLLTQSPASSAFQGDLVIPTVNFNDGSGCIETVGLDGTAKGCIVHNNDLAGYASRVEFETLPDSSIVMLMVVPASDFVHSSLKGYDVAGGTLWTAALTPSTEVVGDVAVCPNNAFVTTEKQKTAANGVRIYENMTEVTTAPLAIGLNPQSQQGAVCY